MRKAFFCLNVTDQFKLWQLPFTTIDFNVTLKAPNSTIILFNCHKQRLIIVEFGLKESRKDCQLKLVCCFSQRHKSVWEPVLCASGRFSAFKKKGVCFSSSNIYNTENENVGS